MTTKRWLDATSDAKPWERAVLLSGLEADPPPGADRVIWRDLLAALPPVVPAGGGGVAASSATSSAGGAVLSHATLATLAKGFAAGVGVSLAVTGVARLSATSTVQSVGSSTVGASTSSAPRSAPRDVELLVPTPELPTATPPTTAAAPTANTPSDAPETKPSVPESTPPSGPPGVAPPRQVGSVAAFPVPAHSRLEEEAALLNRARAELGAGKLAEAFATLESSRERFSAPELHQEREALTIELLYRSGQRAQAVVRAERFLAQHPESPHVAKIRSFTR
jgi:hypothetical protein